MNKATLTRSAMASARERGHRMSKVYWTDDPTGSKGTARCQACGMEFRLHTSPSPNGTLISGEAFALTCHSKDFQGSTLRVTLPLCDANGKEFKTKVRAEFRVDSNLKSVEVTTASKDPQRGVICGYVRRALFRTLDAFQYCPNRPHDNEKWGIYAYRQIVDAVRCDPQIKKAFPAAGIAYGTAHMEQSWNGGHRVAKTCLYLPSVGYAPDTDSAGVPK